MAKRKKAARRSSVNRKTVELPQGVKLRRKFGVHIPEVYGMTFSPQGVMLASGHSDGTVKLWDAERGRLLHTLAGHTSAVFGVAFNPKCVTLASGSLDGTVRLWDVASGLLAQTLIPPGGEVTSVAFDPQGATLASGRDRAVDLWDVGSGRLTRTLDTNEGPDFAHSVVFDPQGVTLASGESTGSVAIWDVESGRRLLTLEVGMGRVYSLAFDPHGVTLVSANGDGTLSLWDVESGRLQRVLEGHTGIVDAVAFSHDGRLLASKSNDDTIRLWNCSTWGLAAIIPARKTRESWFPSLTFHPTLQMLATTEAVPSKANVASSECHAQIYLYELNNDLLLASQTSASVAYTSAKVVLVGESNVGKSYLAHRIATGQPPEVGAVRSTHGLKFWPLERNCGDVELPTLPEVHANKLFGSSSVTDRRHRRDIVLWDMGGQEEYRLIHQLFLHDTTVALVLMDPTRGATACAEVETWSKALEKQLRGRAAVKILVGSKMDAASQMTDYERIEQLRRECGFAAYVETSALTGRGIEELCDEIARAIDWERLSETNRPELFQAIRDEIEVRRRRGNVVVLLDDLDRELHTSEELEAFSLLNHEIAISSDANAGTQAVESVCRQLAQQGVIARAITSEKKVALILRVEEVERYAGSLILAARMKRRDCGVPALELRTIGQDTFKFPEIDERGRLPRSAETAVVECTVQLLIHHGICFEHEGLLIFPSLFAGASISTGEKMPHSVSLYYDFAGAIDNIYASLVAWLVLAKEFGNVRLSADRAEFEVRDTGLCGLRKVTRPGGFAHVDVYFDGQTPQLKQLEFVSFVEDHLTKHGIEIREHVAIKCSCGEEFAEDTIRKRIARGERDVACSVCDSRHSLVEGASAARERIAEVAQHTWALRTKIEEARQHVACEAIQTIGRADSLKSTGPFKLLHLSDLHFTTNTPINARLQWLLDDLRQPAPSGLGISELDYLVISGDFTDRASEDGFVKAYEFVSGLTREFNLSAERCLFVPGNHDIVDRLDAYTRHKDESGLKEGEWVKQGELVMGRNPGTYRLRLEPFSKSFYHKFLQHPYPLEYAEQGIAVPFWSSRIQFLLFNSCWQIDEFHRKRSGVHVEAVANAIHDAQQQEKKARESGQLTGDQPLLRIAVWHHAVTGRDQMKDTDFLGNLLKNGVRLALHGDIHEYERNQVGYRHEKGIHVVGSGSFGARAQDRPESTPRLFNVLEVARDLTSVRIHTRSQPKPDGPWEGWHEWPNPNGSGRISWYDIEW